MKSLLNNRYIYKLESSRLANANWELSLTREEAIKNNELIGLASSTAIRMIDKMNGKDAIDEKITQLKKTIKKLTKSKQKTEQDIIELRSRINELANTTFIPDLIFVAMKSKKDYNRANKQFKVNGIEYKRLIATSGGVKKFTIIYVNKELHQNLYKWLNNGRDMAKEFVPAKLEAYISLAFSSSIPVSNPNKVVVVHDIETSFKDEVILIDGTKELPTLSIDNNYQKELNACDGMGLIAPSLAMTWGNELQEDYITSGFCIRNAYLKGMVFTFDFHQFAKEVAKSDIIVDVWGQEHDVSDVDLIVTTSMLKLWDSYTSIGHYLECCKQNNHEFAITKMIDEKLNNEQTLNYQFLQSLKLNDEELYQLCKPTIDEFHDVLGGDWIKTLLFLRGEKMNEENVMSNLNDFTSAIMVDPNIIHDKYVHSKIRNSIKNRIDQAKMGVIKVRGNFQIIGGDPYILCQSMFGLETTGLLSRGEFYSNYWNERDVDEIACFRAPMVVHNNIVVRKLAKSHEMRKWYKYIKNAILFNAWDCSCDALAGADFDSDQLFTTNNPYVLKGIDRNSLPIVCLQGSAKKCVPQEKDFIKANMVGAGSKVGSYTNVASTLESLKANFQVGSKEYNELERRLMFSIYYQQSDIDSAKGIKAIPMPKYWYDWKSNEIEDDDGEEIKQQKMFNLKILANKKPYYFIYNYDQLKAEYKQFHKDCDEIAYMKHGKSMNELLYKKDPTPNEKELIEGYKKLCPVNMSNSIINKVAKIFEQEFDTNKRSKVIGYDKSNFKTNKPYSLEDYNEVLRIKKEFTKTSTTSIKKLIHTGISDSTTSINETITNRANIYNLYRDKIMLLGINNEDLCNILVDVCYSDDNSKKFAWLVVGEQMIKNLMVNTQERVKFPIHNEQGDIEYNGERFELVEVKPYENSLQ